MGESGAVLAIEVARIGLLGAVEMTGEENSPAAVVGSDFVEGILTSVMVVEIAMLLSDVEACST